MSDDERAPADPDELDFTDDERVAEIGEGRYVVGTAGRPNVDRAPSEPVSADSSGHAPAAGVDGGGAGGDEVDRQAVSRWLAGSFENDGFEYGLDATLHAEDETSRHRMVSNDVADTFDTLISWFASNAGKDAPPPEVIGLLLVAADTRVDLPPLAIKRFAASQGLSAQDSIADLIRAAEAAGGFRIE